MAALVAIAAALFGASAVQNYLAYRTASNRLFDDSLRETAGLLMQLVEHEVAEHGQMLGIQLLQAEVRPGPYGFRFQIWTPDMQAGYLSSGGTMPFVEFDQDGFAAASFDGEDWRAFSIWNGSRTLQVQVAQRQQVRLAQQQQALTRLALSFVLLLAVAAALIWWIVGRSIRPLRNTAVSVGLRGESDLSPVAVEAAPREVRPLIDALNRLLERIGQTLAAERRFTADAAHELRTPLAAIRANAQVLLGARDAAEREQTGRDLLASVDRGTRLVDQLLALARADRSDAVNGFMALDLAAVAREQHRQHQSLAARLDVQLHGDLQPAPMHGDAGLLSVLIRNLLDNALRYSPAGTRVQLVTRCAGDAVELLVDDEGPGIPEAERSRVFERFHRLAGTGPTGSGLGLSIVLRIVELHGGSIQLEDGPGARGTRVRVRFAATLSAQAEDLGREPAERSASAAPGFEPDLRRRA